jgi:hypothetical protein
MNGLLIPLRAGWGADVMAGVFKADGLVNA